MGRFFRFMTFALLVGVYLGVISSAFAGKPTIAPICKQCHQEASDIVRGPLVGSLRSSRPYR